VTREQGRAEGRKKPREVEGDKEKLQAAEKEKIFRKSMPARGSENGWSREGRVEFFPLRWVARRRGDKVEDLFPFFFFFFTKKSQIFLSPDFLVK
jgi:hypothetical protein